MTISFADGFERYESQEKQANFSNVVEVTSLQFALLEAIRTKPVGKAFVVPLSLERPFHLLRPSQILAVIGELIDLGLIIYKRVEGEVAWSLCLANDYESFVLSVPVPAPVRLRFVKGIRK